MIKLAIAYSSDIELKICVEEYNNIDEIREVFNFDIDQQSTLESGKSIDVSEYGEMTSILIIK